MTEFELHWSLTWVCCLGSSCSGLTWTQRIWPSPCHNSRRSDQICSPIKSRLEDRTSGPMWWRWFSVNLIYVWVHFCIMHVSATLVAKKKTSNRIHFYSFSALSCNSNFIVLQQTFLTSILHLSRKLKESRSFLSPCLHTLTHCSCLSTLR